MSVDWKCSICGAPADYIDSRVFYCVTHWCEHLDNPIQLTKAQLEEKQKQIESWNRSHP